MTTTRNWSLTATAVLALALTACSSDSDPDIRGGSSSLKPAPPALSHIHGLGVDPADDRLYIATHEGVFTPGPKGEARRVGESEDDFMGFAVATERTFLASGHPAAGASGPGNRGLIESTDAGRTWTARSLAGEVDFHALDYAHGTVYGYDSTHGLLRVSKDRTTWSNRARLQALDIAVDPRDPDTVLATTAEGVVKSTDGGRTFAEGRPPVLSFVSWAKPDALYGIDAEGTLHRGADGGKTWRKTATVPGGPPQALTAVDAQRLFVATQDGVYASRDGGQTFTRRLAVASDGH